MADEDLMLVFSNPVAGRDDEFNQWYDMTHLPDVLAVPGVVAARRYTVVDADPPELEGAPSLPPPAHRYLAVYRLERDANEVIKEFLARIMSGTMTLSETLDLTSVSMAVWSPRGAEQET